MKPLTIRQIRQFMAIGINAMNILTSTFALSAMGLGEGFLSKVIHAHVKVEITNRDNCLYAPRE
jgi:hypothetical protein